MSSESIEDIACVRIATITLLAMVALQGTATASLAAPRQPVSR